MQRNRGKRQFIIRKKDDMILSGIAVTGKPMMKKSMRLSYLIRTGDMRLVKVP